jgi:hypothetical protein
VGWIAQLVEQRTENPRVAGSIPAPATTFSPRVFGRAIFFADCPETELSFVRELKH